MAHRTNKINTFRALRVINSEDSTYIRRVETRSIDDLPNGELLVDVHYSSLNYKDALSATGAPGVTRNYPHTPGIDLAGVVRECTSNRFKPGDSVVAIGFDIGMNTDGGFGQCVRVRDHWAVPLPIGLTLRESMVLGTAGFTAALCIWKLEKYGMTPSSGPILVTGATGGVGCLAVKLLHKLNYEVHVVTGKSDQHDFLRTLGATTILSRAEALDRADRPLQKERWGGVVDTVGGEIMMNAIKSLRYNCSLAACGLVSSPNFHGSVIPFILRHANLLGIDSAELPITDKQQLWNRLGSEWKLDGLSDFPRIFTLDSVNNGIDQILQGNMVGRGLVDLEAPV